jgi:hypothetical protein
VVAVKESCIRTVEVPLPASAISMLSSATAAYGQLYGYFDGNDEKPFGLYIKVNNLGPYTITEMRINIENKKIREKNTYIINIFLEPNPPIGIMAPPADRTTLMRLPPGLHAFVVFIKERPKDNNFGEYYSWDVESAKGFIN